MKNNIIVNCKKCNLYNNQLPLLDEIKECDVMWVGLSAKKILNNSIPLDNNTNSGKIIELIENKIEGLKFYKTNLVKCLPLDDNNKLRYPNYLEMEKCIDNLIAEIDLVKPKLIFLLGKKTLSFVDKYFEEKNIKKSNIYSIEHPSYIYVYKRKYINDYVEKVCDICKEINL